MRPPAAAEAGFTLIEILAVVAIIAATVSIAAPLLRGPPLPVQLRADAVRVAAALRITRAAAMAQNRDMGVTLDATRNTFGSPVVPPARIDRRIEMSTETSSDVGKVGDIWFSPTGRSTGGTIRLRLAGLQKDIRVIWATGDVLVSE